MWKSIAEKLSRLWERLFPEPAPELVPCPIPVPVRRRSRADDTREMTPLARQARMRAGTF